jgi:phage/plasmid-associated DNA primase
MIKLPEQLRQPGFEFVLLKPKSKVPMSSETDWQNKVISFDNSRLLLHEGNIGIKGGGIHRLVIVDCDNKNVQEEIEKMLPPTFTVASGGKGLFHFYYYTTGEEECKSFKVLDKDKKTLMDFQANEKYVVTPNSMHENGNTWKVIKDIPIASIPYSTLSIIVKYFDQTNKITEKKKEPYKKKEDSTFTNELVDSCSLVDVINHFGFSLNEHNKMICPFHDDHNASFQVDEDEQTGYCYGCDSKWNSTSFIEKKENCDFKKTLEIMAMIKEKEKELKEDRSKYIAKKIAVKENVNSLIQPQTTIYRQLASDYYKKQPYFYDTTKVWWMWNVEKYCWMTKDETDIMIEFDKFFMQESEKAEFRSRMMEALRKFGRGMKPKEIKPSWIQFKNKIYDVKDGTEFEASPKYFITNPIDWELGEKEDTPVIDKIIKTWVSPKDVPKLYEIMAFVLVPKYFIHCFWFLYSPPGMGKGTFIELILRVIGRMNATATSINRINNNSRFETYGWHKKLLITMSEVSNINELRNSGLINQATGEDPIKAEIKGLANGFDFANYGKFIYPTNKLLKVDAEDGFGRRVRWVNFVTRFQKEADVLDTIPEQEYRNLCKKLLRIAKELWISRRFTGDVDIQERMEAYQEVSKTSLEKFIGLCCDTTDFNTQIGFDELYVHYSRWLLKNNHTTQSKISFSRELRKIGYENKKVNVRDENNNYTTMNIITGIKMGEISRQP